ncbi:hypothetical protein MVES1_003361 [Malassezia vespertilionis]|nr:uncharacterized protein MVES1_003361 [Malassezia vespertilionis]WFD07992.1 hypothetical protein MVES1_003361 [Malassezia vespertilionis]
MAAPWRVLAGLVRGHVPRWHVARGLRMPCFPVRALSSSVRRAALAMHTPEAWAVASGDPPLAEAMAQHAACSATRPLLESLQRNIHADDPSAGLAHIQHALALAYTTLFAPFARTSASTVSAHEALALLGYAAEALMLLGTHEAHVLARKLLTFAQLHVGAVPLVHFRRMAQTLGAARDMELVLQIERVAHIHHPGVHDAGLLRARLLACDALGRDAEFAASWEQAECADYDAHALRVAHCLARHDAVALQTALKAMAAAFPLRASLWRRLAEAYAPLRPLLAQVPPRECEPAELLDDLLRAALHGAHAQHVPYLLALFGVPGSEHLDVQHAIPRAAQNVARVHPLPHTLGLASTWAGRRGMPLAALAFFRAALHAAPHATPRVPVEERRKVPKRDAARMALHHAAAGVVQAYARSGMPARGMAFGAHVLGAPWRAACAADQAPAVPAACVQRNSACTAALLECAGALHDASLARAVLNDARAYGIKPGGRVRRALAALLVDALDTPRAQVQEMSAALAAPVAWCGGRSSTGALPSAVRQAKLCDALAALGFNARAELAVLRDRSVRREQHTPAALHVWVRDTALQPAPDALARGFRAQDAPCTPPPAPEPPSAARLAVSAALGDTHALQREFCALLDAGIRPTAAHLLPLVHALCKARRGAEVLWLLDTAQRAWNIAPTHAMYAHLASMYAAESDWRAVQHTLQDMRKHNLTPDAHLYDTLALAARAQAAQDVLGIPHWLMRGAPNAAVDVARPASVVQHFQLLMQAHEYLGAQQFFQACLARGLVPDYRMRRMLRRAGNYVDKMLRRAPHNGTLQEARRLQQENSHASRFATRGRTLVAERRAYRKALLGLVRDVVAGRVDT